MRKLVSFLLFFLTCSAAFADVIGYGAATRCDRAGFEIAAVTQHGKEFSIITDSMDRIRILPNGSHKLKCRIGKKLAQISVRVFSGDNGMCMGGGYVDIGNLSVGSAQLAVKGPFNWNCPSYPGMLVKLRIYPGDGELWLERCTAKEWGDGEYVGFQCEYTTLASKMSK